MFTAPTTSLFSATVGLQVCGICTANGYNTTIRFSLFLADASNNPQQPALASDDHKFTIKTTPAYFTVLLPKTPGWSLTRGTKYILVLSLVPGAPVVANWITPNPLSSLSAFGGFAYVATRFSANGGASWGPSSVYNAFLLRAV